MTAAVLGNVSIEQWIENAPHLHRHFFDTPRRRHKQSAAARQRNLTLAAMVKS